MLIASIGLACEISLDIFDYFRELRIIIDVLYPIQLESDRLISAKPALAEDFERGTIALYRNPRREGMIV